MKEFTVLENGDEIAEIKLEDKEIEVVPKNLLKQITTLPSLGDIKDIIQALASSGYEVKVKKGPIEICFGEEE